MMMQSNIPVNSNSISVNDDAIIPVNLNSISVNDDVI